jgi:hypothetical protein
VKACAKYPPEKSLTPSNSNVPNQTPVKSQTAHLAAESLPAIAWNECPSSPECAGWSKEFLEAGKRRLAGDTARAATTDEVKDLRAETTTLKEVVAEQALEIRLLKKSMIGDGEDEA